VTVVIVDTGVANRYSIRNALDYIGCKVEVSADPKQIRAAERLVFPGVGAFEAGMRSLHARGLLEVLRDEAIDRRKPILGICLGMQMMAEASEEDGTHLGLSWIPGRVRRLKPDQPDLKVPHIGFNTVTWRPGSHLFRGLPEAPDFYFLHSYYLDSTGSFVSGTVDYGGQWTAAIERNNIMAVQFHPEKSQAAGLQLLRNFINLT
jgi:imidazole glycerol-phosphate synthase subunit HisH